MFGSFKQHLAQQLEEIRRAGLYKSERTISTPQDAHVRVGDGQPVLNLCANNYLGLAEHPAVVKAAHEALDKWGYGLSSVRFICGTQSIHKQLEAKISEFLATEDTILYSRRCSDRMTPSSPTSSTTPASSTEFVSAKPGASVTGTATWKTSRRN